MATVTLEVEDKELAFFTELVERLSFVEMKDCRPLADEGDSDEAIIANIKEGVRQMRLIEQGKMKSRPAREFLKEL